MTALGERLRARIHAKGPITFAEYMRVALYDPELGYYARGVPRSGWRGHFVTSAELDPAFGALWGGFVARAWEASGQPSIQVVEVGAGEGGFAEALLDGLPRPVAAATSYVLVEPIAALRARQELRLARFTNITWRASLRDVARAELGLVFLNEVLDNLPVHIVETRAGRLCELWVDAGDDLELVSAAPSSRALAEHLERLKVRLPEGHRAEVCLEARALLANSAATLRRGALVVLDYGAAAEELARRETGTVATYSRAGARGDALAGPGERDITAHVNWSWVRALLADAGMAAVGPSPQRAVLEALGLRDLDVRARAQYERAVAEGRGRDAVRAVSRRQALAALADPGGLGGLGVMLGLRGLAADTLLGRARGPAPAGPRVGLPRDGAAD